MYENIEGPHEPYLASLPDGTVVDIATKEGANAFLNGASTNDIFSVRLKEIRHLRKKQGIKKRLNARNSNKLTEHYNFIDALARCADRDIFREKIPESEIQEWLNWVIEEIQSFSENQYYINSGRLDENDYFVLALVDSFFDRHSVVVNLAFECGFFQVVASFIKARKGNGRALPHALICGFVGRLAFYTFVVASFHGWSVDKIFKKFEESGFLEQIIRCSTVPKTSDVGEATWESQGYLRIMLGELQSCISILTQKFKSGKPCGETLKAILDGRDGNSFMETKVLNLLKGIAQLVELMDATEFKGRLALGTCSYCCKTGNPELSFCSRCRFVLYCSGECQKADWKMHKCGCQKLTRADWARVFSLQMVTRRFMNQNFEAVFKEIDKKCDSTGILASEVAVEINFQPTIEGIIPAFQDPPILKVVPIQNYICGEAHDGWFAGDSHTDIQRSWIKNVTKKFETDRKSTSGILVVHHASRLYIDFETIEHYRQAGSCLEDTKMKLGNIWCSHPVSLFHKSKHATEWDWQVIDSSFQLGNVNPK